MAKFSPLFLLCFYNVEATLFCNLPNLRRKLVGDEEVHLVHIADLGETIPPELRAVGETDDLLRHFHHSAVELSLADVGSGEAHIGGDAVDTNKELGKREVLEHGFAVVAYDGERTVPQDATELNDVDVLFLGQNLSHGHRGSDHSEMMDGLDAAREGMHRRTRGNEYGIVLLDELRRCLANEALLHRVEVFLLVHRTVARERIDEDGFAMTAVEFTVSLKLRQIFADGDQRDVESLGKVADLYRALIGQTAEDDAETFIFVHDSFYFRQSYNFCGKTEPSSTYFNIRLTQNKYRPTGHIPTTIGISSYLTSILSTILIADIVVFAHNDQSKDFMLFYVNRNNNRNIFFLLLLRKETKAKFRRQRKCFAMFRFEIL